jgi:hypothetical protein
MKKCLILLLGVLVLVAGMAYAQGTQETAGLLDEEMDYIIKKGDTLWDISERFYKDPFLWPLLWQQNQYVTNPHWIFPGDRIRLYPYKLLIKEIEPGVGAPVPPGRPLPAPPGEVVLRSYPEAFMSGFITDELDAAGCIVGARDERTMLSEMDQVYLTFKKGLDVSPADQYTIFRIEGPIIHPITGHEIGKKVLILGRLQVTTTDGPVKTAEILQSYDPIYRGDRLMMYIPPVDALPTLTFGKREYGWIVAAMESERSDFGDGDIVYIDRGANDGMRPGHLFEILRAGDWVIDPMSKEKVKLPDDVIGRLAVIGTQPRTSTAVILSSRVPVHVGDEIAGLTERP